MNDNDNDDDEPPLLMAAFDRYKAAVLKDEPEETHASAMLHFMAGATVVCSLVRDAAANGASPGAAFAMLASETDSFTHAINIYNVLRAEPEGKPH